jgi:hypothetical protein
VEKIMSVDEPNRRELTRLQVLDQALPAWRKDNDQSSRIVLEAYDGAHREGEREPVLTREASDATLDTTLFIKAQVTGTKQEQPGPEQRERALKQLQTRWPTMKAEQKTSIARAPLALGAMRAFWAKAPEADKASARARWKREFPQFVAEAKSGTSDSAKKLKSASDRYLETMLRMQILQTQYETTRTIIDGIGGYRMGNYVRQSGTWVYKPR